jgi:hypothetical protein
VVTLPITAATDGIANSIQDNAVHVIADVGLLLLDGVAVPAGSYTLILGINFSSAVLPISDGTHTTVSANPHGITVEGFDSADTGVFFVNVLANNNTSKNIDSFNAGDGQVNVSIVRVVGALPGNATVEGIDGAGNSCLIEVVFNSNNGQMCDVDVDGDIDRLDLRAISYQ